MAGDVGIVVALSDQVENLAFAVGKFREKRRLQAKMGSSEEVDLVPTQILWRPTNAGGIEAMK